ncbi:hypothetical protein HNQ95_002555 [Aminobacter ciceronei]|uniref:Uncharacterized protein n=1 Tax=Aminobacter ciceronei TaxID=150723 RepID=A0ABR6C6C7_9HYPH|nr:hypothetical protein [Aminobacter ciceronei]MBA9020554.1 hypothetical protein [Aminobacter ciceronei]
MGAVWVTYLKARLQVQPGLSNVSAQYEQMTRVAGANGHPKQQIKVAHAAYP